MLKAYETGADRLWVLNVGDIKPLEYNIQFFMDMAYNIRPFKDSRYVRDHLKNWANYTFGSDEGQAIEKILWEYYQLALERGLSLWVGVKLSLPLIPLIQCIIIFILEMRRSSG
jgi:hypothetical protein